MAGHDVLPDVRRDDRGRSAVAPAALDRRADTGRRASTGRRADTGRRASTGRRAGTGRRVATGHHIASTDPRPHRLTSTVFVAVYASSDSYPFSRPYPDFPNPPNGYSTPPPAPYAFAYT